MLCRVFHKSKEDDNSSKLLQYETTPSSLTLLASSSPTNQAMPHGVGYNNRLATSFSNSFMPTHQYHHHFNPTQNANSLMDLLHFSRETNTNNTSFLTQIGAKGDDEYGFLWDMDLEENSLDDGVASNLDAIRFEVDNNNTNNNNMVLL